MFEKPEGQGLVAVVKLCKGGHRTSDLRLLRFLGLAYVRGLRAEVRRLNLMAKVAYSCQQHGQAQAVGGFNDFGVAL